MQAPEVVAAIVPALEPVPVLMPAFPGTAAAEALQNSELFRIAHWRGEPPAVPVTAKLEASKMLPMLFAVKY